jgi:hypothetical protein
MNIREISDVFKDTANQITAIKSYNFGWPSDRTRSSNTEDYQELNEFPRVFFSVPTITGSDQTRKQDTYQVTLFFDDLLGYNNEGDADLTLQLDKWAALQEYANYFVQRLNKVKQSILPNYLFIPEAPSITFDSFTGLQRMITVQLSFTLVVPTNCEPVVTKLVECIANIVTSSNLTAALKNLIDLTSTLQASSSLSANLQLTKFAASSLNANASLNASALVSKLASSSLTGAGTLAADLTVTASVITVDYLVVAGGGGSGNFNNWNAGGGAGGYRCNVIGENSGGGSIAESALNLTMGTYSLIVGSGGSPGSQGSLSKFNLIESIGGGYGGQAAIGVLGTGGNGGSGGGGSANLFFGGSGTVNQGFAGGRGSAENNGGGGGAGGLGGSAIGATAGVGGIGVTSNINGTFIRGVGGSGGPIESNGLVNTGNGGSGNSGRQGKGSGGSGIIILKIPDTVTATFSAGVTQSTATSGGFKTITITAAGVSDTVTFS